MSWRDYATERANRTREAFERMDRQFESQLAGEEKRERELDYTPLFDAIATEPDPPAGANE